jgi:hypothetical protein
LQDRGVLAGTVFGKAQNAASVDRAAACDTTLLCRL